MPSSKSSDFFAELEVHKAEKVCGLKDALREMDDAYRAQVKEALGSSARKYPSTAITAALKKRGFRVNEWQVRRCRSTCECGELKPSNVE